MFVWAHEGISRAARDVIEVAGYNVCTWDYCPDDRRSAVVWTRLKPPPAFASWPLIATPCTDSSHCNEARKAGIRVLSLRDCGDLSSITATVEFTIGAILSLTRRIPSAVESVRRGEWDRMRFQGTDLKGKLVLVVGYGRIGRKVHWILENAFGMQAFAWDTDLNQPGTMGDYLLKTVDLVTVHASLNETSRGMFGHAEFAAMKPGAMFINTARGAIVDEAALLDALKSGHLAGAALDVLCQEPPPADSPLIAFARENPTKLLLTPHIGGCSVESMEKAETLLARKLVEVLRDGGC